MRVALVVLAAAVLGAGCAGGDAPQTVPVPPPAATTAPLPVPAGATVAPGGPATGSRTDPPADPQPPAPGPEASTTVDDDGVDVVAVQRRLAELGFYRATVDGVAGAATTAAVVAFQKVTGLSRDGVVGPRTLAALAAPLDVALVGGEPDRIEADLDAQVVHVVSGGVRIATLNASSGNGETYRSASGGWARARTPVGEFRVTRKVAGVRRAALGTLYDPLYYHGGFALHGSASVPAHEASHGCVRLTRADAAWLAARTPVGTQVVVHGGVHVFAP